MRVLTPVLTGTLSLALGFGASAPAGADQVTDDAVAWLESVKEVDGGFELANFPPFETPDAVLALATHAQTTGTWSLAEARAAIDTDTLKWLDDFAEASINPALAAKFILLVALPLGDDATAYDPEADGNPVDLTAGLDTINPALFNSFMFGRLAESALDQNVHQADLQVVCEAQQANGGWSFDANPSGSTAADLDTTGFATMALVAAGVEAAGPELTLTETFLQGSQLTSPPANAGAWVSFGSPDPNATDLAMLAWAALGQDLAELVADPVAWLATQQLETPPQDVGRIQSPNDGFGITTFATSQTITALHLAGNTATWLPLPAGPGERSCLAEHSFPDVPASAWYDDGARYVDAFDIATGFAGQGLLPRAGVNRGQASMWLNNVFGAPGGDPHGFNDVPANAWYAEGVDFVGSAPNGVIATGFPDGGFHPRTTLNRGQAVSWLYHAAGSPDVSGLPAHGMTDVPAGAWNEDAVTWAVANAVVSGFPDDTFRSGADVNRGQFSQWLFSLVATPEAWIEGAGLPPTVLFG